MNVQEGFSSSMSMMSVLQDIVLRNQASKPTRKECDQQRKLPMKSLPGPSEDSSLTKNKLVVTKASKKGERSQRFANGIKEHVKGKLSLGAKLLRAGSMEKIFKQIFGVIEGEQLLKASQCRLSTTAGPIAGVLFISTDKLAFCSDRSIVKVSSPTGEFLRFHYKVVIPLRKIEEATKCKNTEKKSKKYLHLITTDGFEFWFLGFLNYKNMFKSLQKAISQSLDFHN